MRLCSVWPTRLLIRPSRAFLYVASQIWCECDRRRGSGRYLRTHSQASFPRAVTRTQLPSPSACSLEAVIWYTDLLEVSYNTQGTGPTWTAPHKFMPMTGVPKKCTRVAGRAFSDGESLGRNRVISTVLRLQRLTHTPVEFPARTMPNLDQCAAF